MRILFIGDIFGKPGRQAVARALPRLRREERLDFVVANGENASHGAGLSPEHARELFDAGADVITLGNHTWDKKDIDALLQDPRVLRPANYPPGLAGKGHGVYEVPGGGKIGVLQLMGRHNMPVTDCPFRAADALLKDIKADVLFVDMHAEASSEKQAMGWHLAGRVSAVVGSHTHVQTADERILPGGTAYLGDAGMTGPRDGIIGAEREAALRRFLLGVKVRYEPAPGATQFCAALVETGPDGKGKSIRRICEVFDA